MFENSTQPYKEGELRSTDFIDKNSIFYHPFNFISKKYRNDPDILLRRLLGILGIGLTGNIIKNKKLRFALKVLQHSLTAGILGSEFIMHVKHYIQETKIEKSDPYKKRMFKVSKLLEIPEDSKMYGDVPNIGFEISPKIAMWFAQHPKTKELKIIDYFNMSTLERLEKNEFKAGQNTGVGILFEYKEQKILWDLIFITSAFETTDISSTFLLGATILNETHNSESSPFAIACCLIREFVNTLNISDNVLKFDNWGSLICSPRRHVVENLNQFDVKRFIKEITWVLSHKSKRTYAFVGRQGTGKSSIMREIEGALLDYMIIHLGPDDFKYSSLIKDRFAVCKMFQPVIVIIEDMDACGLKDKNGKTGTFLECIDEVNKDLNMVIIYSVNDTSLVHHTIINRPGRSDRVIEIFPPRTAKEALEVIQTRFEAIKGRYEKDFQIVFDKKSIKKVASRCVEENFTQAELTNAVVEQAFIEIGLSEHALKSINLENDIFATYLDKAVDTHIQTRKAIQNCNFHNTNPDDCPEDEECIKKQEQSTYYEVATKNS